MTADTTATASGQRTATGTASTSGAAAAAASGIRLTFGQAVGMAATTGTAVEQATYGFGTWVGTTRPDRWTSTAHPTRWVGLTLPARRWTQTTRTPKWLSTTRGDRWIATTEPQRFIAHTRTPKWLTTTIHREGATVALTTVPLGPYTQNEVPEPLLIRVLETRRDDTTAGKPLFNQSPAWTVTAYIEQPDSTLLTRACTILDPAQLTTLYPDDFATSEEGWVQVAWAAGDLSQLTGSGYQIQLGLNNGTLLLKSTTVWSVEVNDAAAAAVTLA